MGKLWHEEKLLIMSNFSICLNAFKSGVLKIGQNGSASGKGLSDREDFVENIPFNSFVCGLRFLKGFCGDWFQDTNGFY